ncbi:MAG: transglutaminase domain-containing protein [Clostridia bacterium]|nr:transglutaminase domain-containing protein [Clostridia bacterium]
MKKRYWIFISIVLFFMISSILIFIFKISNSENNLLFTSYLNDIYSLNQSPFASECNANLPQTYAKNAIQTNKNIQSKLALKYKVNTGFDSLLSQTEKNCYQLIKNHCGHISKNRNEKGLYLIEQFTIKNSKLSAETIKKVLYAIQNDNPDIFWISNTFSYCYSRNDTIIKLYSVFSANEKIDAEQKLKEKVLDIISKIPPKATEYEKELFLHDYIVNNCEYNKSANSHKIFTCYGCLVEQKAVCSGYSKAMQLLMNTIGINCITIAGSSKNEPHMWNIVKINDKCYHLDVTWDGVGGLNQYNYFNVNDEIIKKDHNINPTFEGTRNNIGKIYRNFNLPKCSELQDNYYEKNAVKISDLSENSQDKIVEKLLNIANSKKEYLYIKTVDNLNFDTAVNRLIKQNPYKLFSCIRRANKFIPNKSKKFIDNNIQFSINKFQNVLAVKLSYV